ncbi:hypothetical protein PP175_29000 (plasmid) [Aneurinibacillus sp. Ricciae_BoGa-3]|uniref:hypothetical protein n=1 Tax=Aneurinibacillus sp. Ricciae_BoGa-3 TaxID=3022697 RepID=UPI00233FEBD6|nr:hypothetical protein [Aneurinibacillus sp. Ricciae_BoGa-3]WCK57230.1 hypothetical protein PP175_29000 [Aneurinibacillus sp. Ricciae_BoGa-3]
MSMILILSCLLGVIGIGVSLYCLYLMNYIVKMENRLKQNEEKLRKKDELIEAKEIQIKGNERLILQLKEEKELKDRTIRSLRSKVHSNPALRLG